LLSKRWRNGCWDPIAASSSADLACGILGVKTATTVSSRRAKFIVWCFHRKGTTEPAERTERARSSIQHRSGKGSVPCAPSVPIVRKGK